jgi:hypothetical protein
MADSRKLSKAEIERLLGLLNEELAREGVEGELYLVGGAVRRPHGSQAEPACRTPG